MKAAVLKALGSPLAVESIPSPVPGAGEVVVDIAATRIVSYAGEVFSGARRYLLELPIVPGSGGIGRVRTTGPDATRLAPGDWVYCDPTVRSRDSALTPDIILQGVTAGGEAALPLQRHFHDGSFAEQTRIPLENAVSIGAIEAADAGRWCALGTLLVPYGGFLAARLQPGETVVVNGATGAFGGAGVAVALAMGAARVVATGRNGAALQDLARRFGPRVAPVQMRGDEAKDRAAMQAAAAGPIDCVLDILPPMASAAQARAAITAVRPYGRVALMGGVGMQGGGALDLDYAWLMRNCVSIHGQWMYPPDAGPRMVGMIRSGLIDLAMFEVTSFALDDINEAVAHAAVQAGPFRMTVVRPEGTVCDPG